MAAQSYSTGINQQNGVRLFWYSDWLPRYPSPKLKKLKIYETCCVNGRHWKKYFKYDNFLTPFCLLLSVECFGQILRKSMKSTYPINSLNVDTFFPGKVLHYSHVFDLLTSKTKEKQSWQWVKFPKARGNPASRNEMRQPKKNKSNRARTFGLIWPWILIYRGRKV